jgi:hypothetical protein
MFDFGGIQQDDRKLIFQLPWWFTRRLDGLSPCFIIPYFIDLIDRRNNDHAIALVPGPALLSNDADYFIHPFTWYEDLEFNYPEGCGKRIFITEMLFFLIRILTGSFTFNEGDIRNTGTFQSFENLFCFPEPYVGFDELHDLNVISYTKIQAGRAFYLHNWH